LNRDHSWAALDEFQQLRLRLNSQSAGSGVRAKTVATDPVLETYARGLSLEARHARRAQHQFALVLARHPDSFWANYRIAACACRLGDYEEAAERLRHCLRRLPGNATLWTQLAACLIQIDRIDDAEQACDEALRLSPQLLEARQARAILYSRANQKARLKEDLQLFGWLTAHVDAIKRWDLMVLLEYAQRRNKDGSVATRESEPQLSGIQAEDAMAHALRGCLREWDGQWREAIAEYDRALASNSDHLWALYRRGQVKSRFDARAAHRDYETLVHHDRAEELFGQQPQALRVYYFLIVSRLRDAGRSADVTLRKRQHSDAIAMARIAAERAELAREPSLIVEMKMLLARTLVAATESPSNASAEVAELVRSASILDPVRTHELLTTDRLFTTPLRAPSWIPRRDPARRFLSPDRMSR
jgi:tetratricopeptide (TPR) repeat protein